MNLFDVPSDHPRNSAPDRLAVPALTLTPTDVSQYLRLDRCDRFLRLRLHERNAGRAFLTEYDVAPQAIPPLLTRSGAEFEETIAGELSAEFGEAGVQDFAQEPLVGPKGKRLADNGRLVAALRGLPPGERRVICQPRLSVSLGAWRIRGDADLLRVEREPVSGALRILVTDMKSSAEVRVEHRLQVAFYQAMLAKLLADSGVFPCHIDTAILYRPPAEVPLGTPGAKGTDPVADEKAERESAQALAHLGVRSARMEVVANGDAYRAEVENLVTGANSDALRVATAPFDRLFFSLGLKCDGCLYSEFCMKDAHERADVALIPFLPARDKKALASAGVRTVGQLATLKEFVSQDAPDLVATPETVATVRQLSATTVGPRLDELVLRARGNRASQRLGLRGLSYLPSKGHTTLPFTSPEHNPNLVCVYIDAQHDYLHDRVYLLGALVVAHEDGVPVRQRHIVHLTDGPPDSPEAEAGLFAVWIRETIATIVSLAASNAADERRAPIHLIFWNDFGQRLLLDALARNMTPMVAAAPALYDFVTQMAAFDSPIATFLDDEIRERKNYPMFCQSLTAISQYLGFAWDESPAGGKDWRKIFRERLFDRGGKTVFDRTQAQDAASDSADTTSGDVTPIEEFYERRSRHSSQIPLEYAYAAWGAVPPPIKPTKTDSFAPYRKATRENLVAFQRRRLDAVAHIAGDFEGNRLTEKSTFSLPDLATFRERANHLAGALREFGVIERHVALAAWKTGRQLPPERRVLLGETLLVRYVESDQEADVASQNRDNKIRKALKDDFIADFRAAKPDAKQVRLTPEQKAECEWSMEGMPFRLRFDLTGVDADLPTILGLLNLKDGDRFVLYPRWSTDTRLPIEEQTDNTPTPKQMLYGTRVELLRIDVRKNESGHPTHAFAEVSVCSPGGGSPGYLFSAMDRPLEPNALYTLDPDPNDIYGLWQSKVTDALCDLEQSATPNVHPLYSRVAHPAPGGESVPWPPAAATGQERFLLGLDAFPQCRTAPRFRDEQARLHRRARRCPAPAGSGTSGNRQILHDRVLGPRANARRMGVQPPPLPRDALVQDPLRDRRAAARGRRSDRKVRIPARRRARHLGGVLRRPHPDGPASAYRQRTRYRRSARCDHGPAQRQHARQGRRALGRRRGIRAVRDSGRDAGRYLRAGQGRFRTDAPVRQRPVRPADSRRSLADVAARSDDGVADARTGRARHHRRRPASDAADRPAFVGGRATPHVRRVPRLRIASSPRLSPSPRRTCASPRVSACTRSWRSTCATRSTSTMASIITRAAPIRSPVSPPTARTPPTPSPPPFWTPTTHSS